jgi:hypothetical protein
LLKEKDYQVGIALSFALYHPCSIIVCLKVHQGRAAVIVVGLHRVAAFLMTSRGGTQGNTLTAVRVSALDPQSQILNPQNLMGLSSLSHRSQISPNLNKKN